MRRVVSRVGLERIYFLKGRANTITVFKRRVIAFCECRPSRFVEYHASCGKEVLLFCCGMLKVALCMKSVAGVPFQSFCRELARRVKTYYVSCGKEVTYLS